MPEIQTVRNYMRTTFLVVKPYNTHCEFRLTFNASRNNELQLAKNLIKVYGADVKGTEKVSDMMTLIFWGPPGLERELVKVLGLS